MVKRRWEAQSVPVPPRTGVITCRRLYEYKMRLVLSRVICYNISRRWHPPNGTQGGRDETFCNLGFELAQLARVRSPQASRGLKFPHTFPALFLQ